MIKGTTPTHTWTLPFSASNIKTAKVTYAQDGFIKITKHTSDCRLEGQTLTVELTQDETLSLNHHRSVEVQLRVVTTEDKGMATKARQIPCDKCLDREVLE